MFDSSEGLLPLNQWLEAEFLRGLYFCRTSTVKTNDILYWLTALARKPPSTAMIWPVVKLVASEAR